MRGTLLSTVYHLIYLLLDLDDSSVESYVCHDHSKFCHQRHPARGNNGNGNPPGQHQTKLPYFILPSRPGPPLDYLIATMKTVLASRTMDIPEGGKWH